MNAAPVRNVTRDLVSNIEFRDLEFAGAPVQCYSSRGTPFLRWEPMGMPRIPPKVLDCVCYLYEDEEHAIAGLNFGGTGFLVAMPSERFPGTKFTYAVTNWHVACQGAPVVRLNTKDGGTDIIPLGAEQWEFDPRFDIAVAPLPIREDLHRYALFPTEGFLKKEDIDELLLGPGEDVFMIGRFVDHDGGQVNIPAVRFGNISVMPSSIEQPNGRMADMFCIDLHSRNGYSGSPVCVYRTPGFDLEKRAADAQLERRALVDGSTLLVMLGIHVSQFKELWEIVDKEKAEKEAFRRPLITEGAYVRGLSGMTCVLPAWNILEVLNRPKLREHRRMQDDMEAQGLFGRRSIPDPELAKPQAGTMDDPDWLDPEEAARRRDETLRRMLAAPPKPQKDMRIGRRKPREPLAD